MRPLTRILSVAVVISLTLLVLVLVRISRRMVASPAVDEAEAEVADSGPPGEPATHPAPSAVERFARMGGHSVPKFEPEVLSGEAVRGKLREEARKDGFLFREEGGAAIYMVQNGTKFQVPNMDEFRRLGLSPDDVRDVPAGALNIPEKPPDKTLFRERDDPRVFYFENGQKRWVSSRAAFDRAGHKWDTIRIVPKGTMGAFTDGAPVN